MIKRIKYGHGHWDGVKCIIRKDLDQDPRTARESVRDIQNFVDFGPSQDFEIFLVRYEISIFFRSEILSLMRVLGRSGSIYP